MNDELDVEMMQNKCVWAHDANSTENRT